MTNTRPTHDRHMTDIQRTDQHIQVGGRAATLQQLARVVERRGEFTEASRYLSKALDLYRRAYGESVPHVNIAAVQAHLGNIACSRSVSIERGL